MEPKKSLSRRDAIRLAGVASALSVGLGVTLEANAAPAAATQLKAQAIKLDAQRALKMSMDIYKLEGATYQKVASLPIGALAHKAPGQYSYKLAVGDETLSDQPVDIK